MKHELEGERRQPLVRLGEALEVRGWQTQVLTVSSDTFLEVVGPGGSALCPEHVTCDLWDGNEWFRWRHRQGGYLAPADQSEAAAEKIMRALGSEPNR